MRWLVRHRRNDRGATAVLVAISMVVLLGFTSFGVDGVTLWSDHQQLQNGADAGALAIAQTCAADPNNCAGNITVNSVTTSASSYSNSTAQTFAEDNKSNGDATHTVSGVSQLDTSQNQVTVTDSYTRNLWFAPVIGIKEAKVSASATAKWGTISGGTFLPLTISLCAFYAQSDAVVGQPIQTDTPMTIYYGTALASGLSIGQDPSGICGSGSGGTPPGGFNWVGNQNHDCTAAAIVNDWLTSQPGNVPKGCDFGTSLAGQTIQIPVFDATQSQGSNAQYHIYAIANFLITGYCFHPNDNQYPLDAKCVGDQKQHYISGYFVSFTSLADWTTGGSGTPNLGADTVFLTK